MVSTPSGHGYWITTATGDILPFGDARSYGSLSGVRLNAPVVGMAATSDGTGYWVVAADGGVFSFGAAHFYGSAATIKLNAPVVGMAATVDNRGYWLAAADGGVFTFGDASFGGCYVRALAPIDKTVTAIAPLPIGTAPDDQHYMLATAGGNVPAFGFSGGSFPGGYLATSQTPLAGPMVSIAWAGGVGYWTAASDGGVFTFGDAHFYGSMGGRHMNAPVVAMAATPDHHGYWLLGNDGGVFTFGDAPFLGSAAV
jgi:hypothetical protein